MYIINFYAKNYNLYKKGYTRGKMFQIFVTLNRIPGYALVPTRLCVWNPLASYLMRLKQAETGNTLTDGNR